MSQSVVKQDRKLLGKIVSLYKMMLTSDAGESAERIKELGRKAIEEEFSIAFCGHFSAGKSSMINKLIGEEILPSSPIPTSANLVRIVSGAEYAKVFFKEGRARIYPAPYDYESIKTYCKDGNQIQTIEISHGGAGFLDDMVLMDTPGIDSTDAAHRIAAESALHLSDLVFYVMDYNHVQSELNFLFTKELTEAGKEVYLVINQIDKHQDTELSFPHFKESVESAFAQWGVKHSGIFYTTLREDSFPYNQFAELRNFIVERKGKRKEILPRSVFKSMEKLADNHLLSLEQNEKVRLAELDSILKDVSEDERNELPAILLDLNEKKLKLLNEDSEREFSSGINNILDNAYLMPFQTRELAESYLQSVQPDFKVGLLFSKQKTEQEKKERLNQFYLDLKEKVQTQLNWHLKDYLVQLLNEHDFTDPEQIKAAQAFEVDFTIELLSDTVKQGARLSGDYVLNYTKDLAQAIKLHARRKLEPFKELFLKKSSMSIAEEVKVIAAQEEKFKQLVSALDEQRAILHDLNENRRILSEILYGAEDLVPTDQDLALFTESKEDAEVIRSVAPSIPEMKSEETVSIDEPMRSEGSKLELYHQQQLQLINKLEFTSSEISQLPGLKKIARELRERAARLRDREFTVALFGAFSAGKSSFANALIGEKILPVSPNPTTAAINKIKPITADRPHKSVIVKIKSALHLLEEVDASLKIFGKSAVDFNSAKQLVLSLKWEETDFNAAEKSHYGFLQAFAKGLGRFSEHFGEEFETDIHSLQSYVADEEKACFVEWIEVYYDCALTRAGITLVDTPGADSINARHTGVAFDYIRNSDAILFVTYYNHAFSKADREFLIQLGRVKDTFELDKMFFIVNAVDLASSAEEQTSVLDYVEGQLVHYGIRNPHIYPVSSLKGLKAKNEPGAGEDQLFRKFEQSFYLFIAHDLMNMVMKAAELKWHQAVVVMEEMISSAEEDKVDQIEKRNKLQADKEAMFTLLANKAVDLFENQLSQEANELTFYIRQRVFFRFGEFFRESFNPALLKDDGRDLKKALESALEELLGSLGFDLSQEMRATTLRIEAFIDRKLKESQEILLADLAKINYHVPLAPIENNLLTGLEFESAFKMIDIIPFKKSLSLFKNPKSFFEKNEKKIMSDELEKLLQEPTGEYLQTENERLKDHYIQELNKSHQQQIEDLVQQINEYYEGILMALSDDFAIEPVKKSLFTIKNYQ